MVDYSEVRHLSPFVSFVFAHLGAFLKSSSGHRPQVRSTKHSSRAAFAELMADCH